MIGRLTIFKIIVSCSPTWVYFLIPLVHLAHMAKWALSYTQQSSPLAGNNSDHLQLNRNRLMDPSPPSSKWHVRVSVPGKGTSNTVGWYVWWQETYSLMSSSNWNTYYQRHVQTFLTRAAQVGHLLGWHDVHVLVHVNTHSLTHIYLISMTLLSKVTKQSSQSQHINKWDHKNKI